MKQTLLKYGIIPNALTQQQSDNFVKYAVAARTHDLTAFYDLIKKLDMLTFARKDEIKRLRYETQKLFNEATELLKEFMPNKASALTSDFVRTIDENFQKRHLSMLFSLSELSQRAMNLLNLCNETVHVDDDEIAAELTLRYVALAEFLPHHELCALYKELYDRFEVSSLKNFAVNVAEYSKLVFLFDEKTKKLCTDISDAYDAIQQNGIGLRLYNNVCTEYATFVNDAYLKSTEL